MKLVKALSLALALLLGAAFLQAFPAARAEEMPYAITVDITNQIVTVYSTADGTVVRQMLCSTGKYKPTPIGTFTLPEKRRRSERTEWYSFPVLDCYAKWATRIKDKILFHSLTYWAPKNSAINKLDVERFGSPASHGCVRLLEADAKWIAKNCLAGTKVKIFRSGKRDKELRAMLKLGSFTIDDGLSYRRYLGMPDEEGELGRTSTGIEVSSLQYRLRDLGVFDGAPDGSYDTDTFLAVRQMQILMGRSVTGTATLDFQEALYSDDAPTAMAITLREGYGGAVVRDLQQNLQNLGLYDGPIDSVYDQDVADAVTVFQTAYGYAPDGEASPIVQKAVHYESGKVQLMFARSGGFNMAKDTYTLPLGHIVAETGIIIREKASTESEVVGRVVNGNTVICMAPSKNGWAKIRYGSAVGFIKAKYVDFFQQEMAVLHYKAVEGGLEYTIGCEADQYYSGREIPSVTFADYLAGGGSLDAYAELGEYVRVNTGNPDVCLNLRETPSTNGAVLAQLPDGTETRVLLNSTDWTLVEYEGLKGYLMNDYVEYLMALDDEEAAVDVEIDADDVVTAAVRVPSAAVYNVDSDDADVLGHLKQGLRVQVLKAEDDWMYIRYEGREGYMRDADLELLDEIEG